MAILRILVKSGAEDVLVNFPAKLGQDIIDETEDESSVLISIDLGYSSDTTMVQEEHLNVNPDVIRYWIAEE